MARRTELRGQGPLERWAFPLAFGASLAAHAAFLALRSDDVDVPPTYAVEQREAVEPMTVRLLAAPAASEAAAADAPRLLTGEAGERAVRTGTGAPVEPAPEGALERRRIAAPAAPNARPGPEASPAPTPSASSGAPLERAEPSLADAPERVELGRAPTLPERVREVEVRVGVEARAGQVGAATRATVAEGGNRAPRYPRRARALGMEGTVELLVTVDAAGRAGRVVVQSSSGHDLLDRAARDAVERWRFVPAQDADGEAVGDAVLVPVTFRLSD